MEGDDPLLWQILLQIFLIILNAVFACAEIAFISINDKKLSKLAAEGNKKAARLIKLTVQPAKFLSVIQVGITFAGFLGSAFAADNFAGKLTGFLIDSGVKISQSALNTISVIVITIILSYFTLVLGELVPKRIAMRNAEKIGLGMSGFVWLISKIFAPVVWFLTISTNAILRLFRIDPNAEDEEVTEEEIRLMVDAGSEKGAIDSDEREFIHNIFDFDDITAEEIMTHRTDVSLLWMDDETEAWEKTINESFHSVYPICSESVDNVVGVLNTKEYFRLKEKTRDNIVKTCVKQAYFIPESIKAAVLFRNMKKNRTHFAVVMDEYGGMSGIVTMNDLLEELVGDLDDTAEQPEEIPEIEQLDQTTWRISGSAPIEEVVEKLGIVLQDDDHETFGGLVFDLLGTIPDDGETGELEGYGLKISITDVKDRRLISAVVKIEEKTDKNNQ